LSGGGRRQFATRIGILVWAAILIALAWLGAMDAIYAQRTQAIARQEADASNQALAFEDQLRGQLLALDQTLRILEREWEVSPETFDIASWRHSAVLIGDLSLHIFIADANGIIRESTRPELVGVDIGKRDYFLYEKSLKADTHEMFIGPSTRGLVTKRLQMNMARRLDTPTGGFAGVIGVSYDTGALTRFYHEADLGKRGLVALIGTQDGQVRALVGPGADDRPGDSVKDSPMFQALLAAPNGTWVGPSAPDGVARIHGFRKVDDRDLAVVVGFDEEEALRTTLAWEHGARLFAAGITGLILVLSSVLLREVVAARSREVGLDRDRAVLARANADLEAARARADARAAELQATLAGMTDGVMMLDPELRLLQWNAHFSEFTGVPTSLLRVGTPMEEILRAQAELGEFGPVAVEAEVKRRITYLTSRSHPPVMERTRPNGRTIELRRSLLPDGGYVTLYTDVTTRKQGEDALHRAREMAEAATEAKSRFVATVSHEIRTPLNAVLSSLALLSETPMSPGQRRMIDMAAQAGDALLTLISDILEMSKMEAGRLVLRPSSFVLSALLDGTVEMFRAQAATRGIVLARQIEAGVPDLVYGDAGRLRQVLINLVSNAAKFAGPGLVEVVAETRTVGGRTMLRLAVRDQGPLISATDRSRLFQPFSRLEDAGAGGKPGTGLGLAICQRLAALMDGDIGYVPVTDATGAETGNEFWFSLPLEQPAALPHDLSGAGSERQVRRRPLPRTQILLVEDIVANQILTATMLRRDGHRVEIASSGEEALTMVARRPYDLVLMDIFMPGMSGLEATRRIRAMPGPGRVLPIVALTANVSEDDRLRCIEAGANDMVSKPVDAARLLDAIATYAWSGRQIAAAKPPPPPAAEVPALDSDRLAELRANLPPNVLTRLVDGCLAELRERASALEARLADGDAAGIEAEAHAMAGIAGGYAMAALEQVLRAVMNAANREDVTAATTLAVTVPAELRRAEDALREAMVPETA
jgi:signal transduction histidine kinase/ActR/RegA family two-component response regulator